jgi:chromosomal replication initiation ATPase DnaA
MCKWVPMRALQEVAGQRALLAQITVAEMTGVRLTQLCASLRGGVQAAFARQMAMYLCRVVYGMTLSEIARAFGRDRSTAAHAIRRIEEAREDPEIDRSIAFLEATLQRTGGLHA